MKKILLMFALFTSASWSLMAADADTPAAAGTAKPAAVITYNEARVNHLVKVGLAATGSFAVDWGDGVLKEYYKPQFCIDSVRGRQVRLYGDFVQIIAVAQEIEEMDLSGCPNILSLKIYENNIKRLDVSHMTKMTGLYAAKNKIENEMDLSGCKDLKVIDLSDNKIPGKMDCGGMKNLSKVDVSGNRLTQLLLPKGENTVLVDVSCGDNELTGIDVTGLKKLDELSCSGNKIKTLDLTGVPALKKLYADHNEIKTIEFPLRNQLDLLNLSFNQLESVDLTPLFQLTGLYLYNNQLGELDLTVNRNLRWVNVEHNNLSVISVSEQPQLALLRVSYNNLSELDVTANKMVNTLYAEHNRLTGVDVSHNPRLYDFNVGNNRLTTLDVSKNPSVYYLSCDSNEIARLDLSANQYLHLVAAQHNKLAALDVQGKKHLRGLFLQDNAIADAELNKIIAALPDVNGKKPVEGVKWSDQLAYSCRNGADVHKAEAEKKGWKVTEKTALGVNRLLSGGSGDVVRRLYYNLSGQRLSTEPARGVYLVREMRGDGSSSARKVTR